MIYNGDALSVQEHDENINYVLPEEGGNLWVDYPMVAESFKNKKIVMELINFLHKLEVATRAAEFVSYAMPNETAEQDLPAEYLENSVIFPSGEERSRSEFHVPFEPRTPKFSNEVIAGLTN
ncbi:MAG: ABC transporter substrate-binding protein [Gammaproteobacteria bacterium]|nr:ABC transporter substrate-binding protein [Gammaproteobacteria bacterium]MDH3465357.1 ABC transporter substrate-binding protein [Gammaproteobacteria bacterium]